MLYSLKGDENTMVDKIIELILKGKYEKALNIEQTLDKSNNMRIYEKLVIRYQNPVIH